MQAIEEEKQEEDEGHNEQKQNSVLETIEKGDKERRYSFASLSFRSFSF